jgi:lipopolysaccharide assembly protein A
MARRRDHQPLQVERTRTSSTWVSIAVAIVFLVLLIIFIAQNDHKVPLHFLGASGTVSEALALIAAAVGGAALVLAVGVARIVQLRIGGRRHNRAVARSQAAAASAPPPEGEAQPVKTEE